MFSCPEKKDAASQQDEQGKVSTGKVVSKYKESRRSTRYYLVLDQSDHYGFDLRFDVSSREYQAFSVGKQYYRRMRRGVLDIDYRLRW